MNVRPAKSLSLETAVFLWEGASVTGVLRTFWAQDEAFKCGTKVVTSSKDSDILKMRSFA